MEIDHKATILIIVKLLIQSDYPIDHEVIILLILCDYPTNSRMDLKWLSYWCQMTI